MLSICNTATSLYNHRNSDKFCLAQFPSKRKKMYEIFIITCALHFLEYFHKIELLFLLGIQENYIFDFQFIHLMIDKTFLCLAFFFIICEHLIRRAYPALWCHDHTQVGTMEVKTPFGRLPGLWHVANALLFIKVTTNPIIRANKLEPNISPICLLLEDPK